MKKILIIFGTRPEAIKLIPIIKKLREYSSSIKTIIATTAQHREMLDQILQFFDIKPRYDLNIMAHNQSLIDLTTKLPSHLQKLYEEIKPDLILVQGDTTSAFIASLIAFYNRIPIGHIEAGLRSFDKFQPFPEEINRKLITHLADYHFAATPTARQNLINEGINKDKIFITGNTVIDTLHYILNKKETYTPKVKIDIGNKKMILLTAHRRENLGKPLTSICQAVKKIVSRHKDVVVVYPVHLNPKVQKTVRSILSMEKNVHLISPLSYFDLIYLMQQAYIILTDSGGIQEEAPSLQKPLLVLRNVTERPEGLIAGVSRLVGTDKKKIIEETERLLSDQSAYQKMITDHNPYGDGDASSKIVTIIKRIFSN